MPTLALYPITDLQRLICDSCGAYVALALLMNKLLNKPSFKLFFETISISIYVLINFLICLVFSGVILNDDAQEFIDTKSAVKRYVEYLALYVDPNDDPNKVPAFVDEENMYVSLFRFIDNIPESEKDSYHWLTTEAGFIDIYLNRYDFQYDIFLRGNMGTKTALDYINESAKDENCRFVLPVDNQTGGWIFVSMFYDFDTADYVRKNFKKVEEICNENNEPEWAVYAPVTTA